MPVSGPDAVLLAARLGADGIQLDLGGPGRTPWLDEADRLRALQSVLVETGVSPLAISVNVLNDIGLTAKEGTAAARQVRLLINRAFDVAVELGIRLVLVPSFRCSAIDTPLALASTARRLRWACAEAQKRDLLVATENVLAPIQLQQLMTRVGSPNLRVMLDTGNPRSVGLDPLSVLQAAGSMLADQIHIKNPDGDTPLSVEDPAILKTIEALRWTDFTIDALVLENDYRNGELDRISADLGWLRLQTAAHPRHHFTA
ncbi:sugar phosphate isomerase/epimerase family protein [Agrobacterium sp. rho-13.3]|nr:sugar phosphate isomerase/epimerase family protein [Agrobacterium sp. rho-13.3]